MDAAEFLGEYPSLALVRRHCTELRWLGRYLIGATLEDPSRHALRELLHHPASAFLRELTVRLSIDRLHVLDPLLRRPALHVVVLVGA